MIEKQGQDQYGLALVFYLLSKFTISQKQWLLRLFIASVKCVERYPLDHMDVLGILDKLSRIIQLPSSA